MSVCKTTHTRYPSSKIHHADSHTPHKTIILECGYNPEAAFFEIDDGVVEEGQ